ncbi:MAG TPA: hypothetical protein VFU17_07300 [Candidatus Limnocylindrales bacterium]|nr:hypothetical protein [Candidatus Limnocylindrales bacterium]
MWRRDQPHEPRPIGFLQRFILDRRVTACTEVDAATVPLASRIAAADALTYATKDLRLPGVSIRWFRPAKAGEPVYFHKAGGVPYGVVRGDRPSEIGVDASLPTITVADVVLHEALHVRQFLDGRDGDSDGCQDEAAAYGRRLSRAGVAKAIAESAEAAANEGGGERG